MWITGSYIGTVRVKSGLTEMNRFRYQGDKTVTPCTPWPCPLASSQVITPRWVSLSRPCLLPPPRTAGQRGGGGIPTQAGLYK